jgi:uncharacterized protein YycO
MFSVKKITILGFLAIALFLFSGIKDVGAYPGDIYITKSTSSKGIAGHIGIEIDYGNILHTSGWKSEPYPTVISKAEWNKRYPKTKIVRHSSQNIAIKAASNAIKYFKGEKIPYSITIGPTNISKTYCSELVWYAYYKAGVTFKQYDLGQWITPRIIYPYDYTNANQLAYNNFRFIDSKW